MNRWRCFFRDSSSISFDSQIYPTDCSALNKIHLLHQSPRFGISTPHIYVNRNSVIIYFKEKEPYLNSFHSTVTRRQRHRRCHWSARVNSLNFSILFSVFFFLLLLLPIGTIQIASQLWIFNFGCRHFR